MSGRAHGRARKASGKITESPKIRKDPIKDYDEAISKQGVHAVSLMDAGNLSNVKTFVSTGSLAVDALLNNKGIPCGRLTEIYGPQHVGKSTLLDQVFANVQRMGGFGVLIDTEAARDNIYVRALGVDESRLRMLQFDDPKKVTIENICDRIRETLEWWYTSFPDVPVVIGWDSLGNTTTNSEIDKDVGDRVVASAAKVLRDGMRKLIQPLARTRCALIIINHQYTNIQTGYARVTPRETYGGQAVRLAASLRLEMFSKGHIKRSDGAMLGREVCCRLDKNRLGGLTDVTVGVLTGRGISNTWTLYQTLKDAGIISVSGTWATAQLGDEKIKFQGWQGLDEKFLTHPEVFGAMCEAYNKVMKHAAV